jgi:hypothetical protein
VAREQTSGGSRTRSKLVEKREEEKVERRRI